MSDERKVLFRIGQREIVENGLYVHVGPSCARFMVVGYNSERNDSTWVSPSSSGLMALVLNNTQLHDVFDNPEPIIYFEGGQMRFDHNYRPTHEQSRILNNWNAELDKAGIGDYKTPNLKLKKQFAQHVR